jgi:UDP-GlcNAc3NAcA epimerase
MKIATVLGARPQFVKAFALSRQLKKAGHREILIHTGQHYDYLLSQVFFDEMGLPEPDINLGVGSGSHGKQTGQMLMGVEEVLAEHKPDFVLVYGDTNSTLAGALAASKLHIPLAHIEAGLRSYNREMPEEINRILTDHCSDLLFCPTQTAIKNLKMEGITRGVHFVGDTMFDGLLYFSKTSQRKSRMLEDLKLRPGEYLLATVHRPYNTDNAENLRNIFSAFAKLDEPIVFPMHPRTRKNMKAAVGKPTRKISTGNVRIMNPVGYLDMLRLEQNARIILTDSGGVQKEAYFFGVPCLTLRPETEWLETIRGGWNAVVGTDPSIIFKAIKDLKPPRGRRGGFGDGKSSERILSILEAKCRIPSGKRRKD